LPAADQIEGGLPRHRLASICWANSARRSGLSSSGAGPAFLLTGLGAFPAFEAFPITRSDPRSTDILISHHAKAIVVYENPNRFDSNQPAFNAKADAKRGRLAEWPFLLLDPTAVVATEREARESVR